MKKHIDQVTTHVKKPINWFRHTRRRNKVLTIIALVIVITIVVNQVQAANAKPEYLTQKVQRDSIVQLVSETGNVSTTGRVDVSSSATGIIEEMYVEDNDSVTTGQNLFKVRSTATEEEEASANATYQSALSSLTTAQQTKEGLDVAMWTKRQAYIDAKNTKNYKDDHTKNPSTNADYTSLEKENVDASVVTTEKDFKAAEKKYKEADVAVKAAQAQVTSAQLSYQATQDVIVKAPSNGNIVNLSYRVGDSVTAGARSSASLSGAGGASGSTSSVSSSPVLTITNFTDYSVKLAINEVDISKVKTAQSAEIALDAFTDRKFDGLVTHVDQVGTNDQGIVTYNVIVDITDPMESIKPGMTANVDIAVDKVNNALVVPNSAIKPYQGKKAVQVMDPQTKEPKYIPVKVGVRSPEKTQILSGVDEGTEVITALKNSQVKNTNLPFGN